MSDTPAYIALGGSLFTLARTFWSNSHQIRAARRKLRLDLFEKRYAIWATLRDNIKAARLKVAQSTQREPLNPFFDLADEADTYLDAKREMIFLFEPRTILKASAAWTAVHSYAVARQESFAIPKDQRGRSADALTKVRNASRAAGMAEGDLIEELRRYMDFSLFTRDHDDVKLSAVIGDALKLAAANRAVLDNDGSLNRP